MASPPRAELICRTLCAAEGGFLTARGYRAAKLRPTSAIQLSDQFLGEEMRRLHADNYSGYGVRKMHALMRRHGWIIGRDQTGRVMRSLGMQGVEWSKSVHRSNYMALLYTDRIIELGATPSTGTIGASYDNALAEVISALYKTELIRQRGSGAQSSNSNS